MSTTAVVMKRIRQDVSGRFIALYPCHSDEWCRLGTVMDIEPDPDAWIRIRFHGFGSLKNLRIQIRLNLTSSSPDPNLRKMPEPGPRPVDLEDPFFNLYILNILTVQQYYTTTVVCILIII